MWAKFLALCRGKPLATQVVLLCTFFPFQLLNLFFDRYTGGAHRPVIFNIDETYPELRQLEASCDAIRTELETVWQASTTIPKYHELDPIQRGISEGEQSWRVYLLNAAGVWVDAHRAECPRTCAAVATIPNVVQAFFSMLEAGKVIPPHAGPYRGYLRCHLGVIIPDENAPEIRIRDTWYRWRYGEALLFDDSWEHEVRNTCAEVRIVLVVDVLRPMPWFPDLINRAVGRLAGVVYGRKLVRRAVREGVQDSVE